MSSDDRFARRVFLAAGIYGIIVLLPQYLVETGFGPELPAPLTNPEHFYGFVGVALVWQLVFLIIARDVRRYRLLMLPAVLEKLAFGIPVVLLYVKGRVPTAVLTFGLLDLTLGLFFVLAYRATRDSADHGSPSTT